ncbi:MAG: DUF4194 domain-containing protein [Chloroflexota bacterium]
MELAVETKIEPYAAAIRKLLKGVIYHDDPVWQQVRDYELPIREYLGRVGLTLVLDEIGNFAYLHDESREDDDLNALPALTSRRPLSFADTLLLVLLRERLDEHELRDIDGAPLILSPDELREMVILFMGDHSDARRVEQSYSASLNRLLKYGYLTRFKRGDDRYVVRPLIRAKVTADELDEIKRRLMQFLGTDKTLDQESESPIEEQDAQSLSS